MAVETIRMIVIWMIRPAFQPILEIGVVASFRNTPVARLCAIMPTVPFTADDMMDMPMMPGSRKAK